MKRPTFWLASYPKSGNTWFRLLLSSVMSKTDGSVDVRRIDSTESIASGRERFDALTLVESGMLTADEVDGLRPALYAHLAAPAAAPDPFDPEPHAPVRFVKTHDGYTRLPSGEPLMAGARGAAGALLFVRDPRDVAPSFANHSACSIDEAIRRMGDPDFAFCDRFERQSNQLRQQLLGWSGFAASWLGQDDLPICVIRYEDLHRDTAAELRRAFAFVGLEADDALIARAVAATSIGELQRQEREHGFPEAPRHDRPFFRRGLAGGWRDELSAGQVAAIERDHLPMMQRLGYAPAGGDGWCARDKETAG